MPAPAFVIRQIADIFTNRAEMMPGEESVEDHHQKRKEERDTVENDRNSMAGLFKGTFNGSHMARVIYDEADRIYRCAQCSHEFIPGPNCQNCGADFGGEEEGLQDDWSDDDQDHDIDLDEVEMDYDLDGEDMDDEDMDSDPEMEEYRQHFENHGHFHAGGARFVHPAFRANRLEHNRLHQEFRQMFGGGPPGMPSPGEQVSSSDEGDSDEESEGSLEGFVVNEEEVNHMEDDNSEEDDDEESEGVIRAPVSHRRGHHVIPISSEDGNDEDGQNEDNNTGPIQARQRQRRRNRRPAILDDGDNEEEGDGDVWGVPSDGRRRSRPQVIDSDDSDSETTGGNSGVSLDRAGRRSGRPTVDSDSEAETNGYDGIEGFSPMQNGDLSADEESHEINGYGEYESLQDESGNESDNTLRIEEHDEESVQWDDEVEVPSSDDEGHMRRPMVVPDPPTRRIRPWEEPLPTCRGNRSQGGVQTGPGSRPISLDSDDDDNSGSEEEEEEYEERNQDVEMSVSPSRTDQTAESEDRENLGNALNLHREEDHSSEDSLQPPRRRRRLRGLANNHDEEDQDHDINHRSSPRQRMNQLRARHAPLAERLTAALAGGSSESRPDPASASASRSRHRVQYAPNPPALEPRRMTRTPRPPPAVSSYEYNGRTHQRFRPQEGYY